MATYNPVFMGAFKSAFSEGKIDTPTHISPEVETDNWYLQWARYAYGLFCAGQCSVLPNGNLITEDRSILELRLYAQGKQPPGKYRQILDLQLGGEARTTAEAIDQVGKNSMLNISFDNVRVYPAFRERVIDRLMGVRFKPDIVAVDSVATAKKQLAYLRDRLAADPATREFIAKVGVAPTNISSNAETLSPDEIDTLQQLGGYPLAAEIEIQEAVMCSFDLARYEPVIRRQLTEDLVDLSLAATHLKHDHHTGRQTIEYIDPAGLIFRTSKYDDCRDMDFAGFVSEKNISVLRAESGFDEHILWKIASSYKTVLGNTRYNIGTSFVPGSRRDFQSNYQHNSPYNNFKIQVMTMYFVGLDVERYVCGIGKMGAAIFDKVNRDSVLNEKSIQQGKTIKDVPTQYVYAINWVVGTDYVYSCGKTPITPRDGVPGDMKAMLPIEIYALNRPSLTSSCISIIDDIQIAILRKRSVMAKMPPPPNIAIDISKMEDAIQLGTMDLSTADLLEIYSIKGYLIYASKGEWGPGDQVGGSPISELPNTTFQYMQTIQAAIDASLMELRMVTGMNEVTDGTGQAAGVLNGVAAGFDVASNRALSAFYTASLSLFTQMASNIARRYQQACASRTIEMTRVLPGSTTVKKIQLLPEYAVHDYEIVVRPMVDQEFKNQILQALAINRQQATINEADYLIVATYLQRDQIELAQFYLAKAVMAKKIADQMANDQTMKAQSEYQAQSAVVAQEAETEREMAVMDGKAKLLTLEKSLENDNAEKEFERQMKLLKEQAIFNDLAKKQEIHYQK